MKKLFLLIIVLTISLNLLAQNDVTKFLGIPVDGDKSEMMQKLTDKGFVCLDPDNGVFEGEFNGAQSYVYVVTTGNKVSRIMVSDENAVGETDIKIRYNNLCHQFENNSKYISLEDYKIPADEKISFEMGAHNKSYQALYFQQLENIDTTAVNNHVISILVSKYSVEELSNPTEEIQTDISKIASDYVFEQVSKKQVWFTISERLGLYYITMFYDNDYNRPHGEDL